jgi:hypothetical protein
MEDVSRPELLHLAIMSKITISTFETSSPRRGLPMAMATTAAAMTTMEVPTTAGTTVEIMATTTP